MKTMKLFEPAMCCSTGLCGVSVDPELLRIAAVLHTLEQRNIAVQRYNLTNAPMEFANTPVISRFLQQSGVSQLPVVLVDNEIVLTGRYPSNEEIINWLQLPADILDTPAESAASSCCCAEEEQAAPCGCGSLQQKNSAG